MTTTTTIAKVNRELAKLGKAERLTRGRGYYYFDGGAAHTWPATAVYVNRADELTVAQWLWEYAELAAAAQ